MLNAITKWSVFLYGTTLIILGLVAYFMSESRVSLIMGAGFGGLLLFSALAMFMGKRTGSFAALVLTAGLTAVFAYRYSVTHWLMPALLAVISGAMLIFLLVQLARWRK